MVSGTDEIPSVTQFRLVFRRYSIPPCIGLIDGGHSQVNGSLRGALLGQGYLSHQGVMALLDDSISKIAGEEMVDAVVIGRQGLTVVGEDYCIFGRRDDKGEILIRTLGEWQGDDGQVAEVGIALQSGKVGTTAGFLGGIAVVTNGVTKSAYVDESAIQHIDITLVHGHGIRQGYGNRLCLGIAAEIVLR